jgi:hypothetical protein
VKSTQCGGFHAKSTHCGDFVVKSTHCGEFTAISTQCGGFAIKSTQCGGFNVKSTHCGGFNVKTTHCGGFNVRSTHCGGFNVKTAHCGGFNVKSTQCGGFAVKSTHCGGFAEKSTHCGGFGAKSTHCGGFAVKSTHCGGWKIKSNYYTAEFSRRVHSGALTCAIGEGAPQGETTTTLVVVVCPGRFDPRPMDGGDTVRSLSPSRLDRFTSANTSPAADNTMGRVIRASDGTRVDVRQGVRRPTCRNTVCRGAFLTTRRRHCRRHRRFHRSFGGSLTHEGADLHRLQSFVSCCATQIHPTGCKARGRRRRRQV